MTTTESVVSWPDQVDEILGGDLVVAVGSPTPKGGVVLNSVTPLGMRDRTAGTVSFTTSLGFGRKLERIAADPRMAVAYHTRRHGHSDRPGLVLVQGVASVVTYTTPDELEQLAARAAQHIGQVVRGRLWETWLAVYYRDRVRVDVHVRRITWWPTGSTLDTPTVLGASPPEDVPLSQPPPRDATTPRVSMRRVGRAARKPHRLLGWVDADGTPRIVPVHSPVVGDDGLVLTADAAVLPQGARRAGLLAHDFRPKLIGLSTATHTGWLTVDGGDATWTPHTRHAFTAPPNKTLLLLGNGAAARWGYRRALRKGRDAVLRHARTTPIWGPSPAPRGARSSHGRPGSPQR